VRLPQGVFAPYTDIPANLLFFERGGPTDTIWYYELPLPEGRKKYSKTAPLQFEEFAGALAWWNAREAQIQRHAHELPLGLHPVQASHAELSEPQHALDPAVGRLGDPLALAVGRLVLALSSAWRPSPPCAGTARR
jgi:type I restriction-modification system DNA methylase subunit